MKIAIPVKEQSIQGNIYPSFGRSPFFMIYDDSNNQNVFVQNEASQAVGGAGTKAAQLLMDHYVDAVISYQIGENALAILKLAKISLYQAKEGSIKDHIQWVINKQLDLLIYSQPPRHGKN